MQLYSQGNYQLTLVKGSDGNTIIDECGQETPAGSTLNFMTKDTVSADLPIKFFWVVRQILSLLPMMAGMVLINGCGNLIIQE